MHKIINYLIFLSGRVLVWMDNTAEKYDQDMKTLSARIGFLILSILNFYLIGLIIRNFIYIR